MKGPDATLAVIAVALVACALPCPAQSMPLSISETISLPEQRPLAIREPMKCGGDGHIYVQFVNGAPEPSVNVISNDGKEIHWASIAGVPDLQDGYLRDFAPEEHGGVFLLVQVSTTQEHSEMNEQSRPLQDRFYIAKFDDTGRYISATRLDADFQVGHFAAFPGGNEFVATGYRGKDLHGPNQELSPVTALFNSDGQVLQYVSLPGDLNNKSTTQHFHGTMPETLDEIQIIDVSFLQDGGDGKVYLVRGTPSGPVYSISPGGEVHRIDLSGSPKEGTLATLKVVEAEIVAEYMLPRESSQTTGTLLLILFDHKGHLRKQYVVSGRQVGLGMACYADHGFTFLAAGKGGFVELRRARIQ